MYIKRALETEVKFNSVLRTPARHGRRGIPYRSRIYIYISCIYIIIYIYTDTLTTIHTVWRGPKSASYSYIYYYIVHKTRAAFRYSTATGSYNIVIALYPHRRRRPSLFVIILYIYTFLIYSVFIYIIIYTRVMMCVGTYRYTQLVGRKKLSVGRRQSMYILFCLPSP